MNTQEEHWMVTLQVVFYPALAIVGIPSNIVTFLIFWRRNCMLSKSSTFYLMAISIADTLVLVFIVVLEITVKFCQEEPFWSREPWCRLRDIFSYRAYNTSTWLVVVFTAERFIAIHTWTIKTKLCTPRSALAAITTILLLSHLLAIPYYWSNVSVYDHNQTRWACIYEPEGPHGYVHALVGAQTLVAYVLPFLIILTLNGLTLRQISLSNKVHVVTAADLTSGAYRVTPLLRSRKRKSVVLLVTVSMSYVLLSVTRAITQIIIRTTFVYGQDRNDYNLQINVAADIGSMLSLSNAAINTYLYACTQAKFRQKSTVN
ncbi:putative G-protein coupled receptor 139 [Salvelinus alpinus]